MKKRLLAFLLAGLMIAALTGCGGDGTEQSGGEETKRAQANEIAVGIAQDLDDSLDHHKAVAAGTKEVMFNVFEGLMKPTSTGDLIPAVADHYTISEDKLTYTFTLRQGVKFHNGDAVTAEDVKYSIQRVAAPTEAGVVPVEALSIIEGIEIPDAETVVIKLTEPSNEFLSYMTVAIEPAGYTQQDTAPVGTGPFKFVSRTAQESIVLERFDEYWGTPAYLNRVTYKIIENAEGLLMGLQSGALDIVSHLSTTQVAQLGSEFHIEEGAMNLVQALYLNHAEKPFDDVRVRQALCYAIDRQEILDIAFDGYGSIINSSMYPAFGKYFVEEMNDYYTVDIAKAKALLADAGYPDGFSMTITVPSNYKPHIDTAEVIVEQLKDIDVTAEIKLVEWESWKADTYAGRKFQSTVVGFDASTMTARALLERWTSDYGKNMINYNDSAYDALFEQAQTCYDDAEQTEIYKEMQKNLTVNAANVYIQDLADLVAVRSNLEGLQFYPIYVLDLSAVRYAK
ncbi:MAG: ABC transporter substrate-binding protein [Ruminococcaceae bacterium]|nr:ABC transporter substrate-binding protein [Oscillospiraceae bacterium]